nr:hypothetical protein [uncultured Acetobacterium sp.]
MHLFFLREGNEPIGCSQTVGDCPRRKEKSKAIFLMCAKATSQSAARRQLATARDEKKRQSNVLLVRNFIKNWVEKN